MCFGMNNASYNRPRSLVVLQLRLETVLTLLKLTSYVCVDLTVQDKLWEADGKKKIRFLSNHSHGKKILKSKETKRKGYRQRKTYQGELNLAEVLKSLESDLEVEATATTIEEREWVNKWRRDLVSCRGEWGLLTHLPECMTRDSIR